MPMPDAPHPAKTHSALAGWMIPPAHGWHHKTARLFWKPLVLPLSVIALLLTLLLALEYLALASGIRRGAQIGLAAGVLAVLGLMLRQLQQRLHNPLAQLRNWALSMRGGHLSARIAPQAEGEFAALARDINNLSDELQLLAEDMERRVRSQTSRLAQKNQSLEILYDVAASLNAAHDLDELLTRFLQTLMKVVNARAAAVRLITEDGHMRLVGSIGLDEEVIEKEQYRPTDCCLCGMAVASGEMLHQKDLHRCSRELDLPLFAGQPLEMLVVPLQYRDKVLGVYNLFTDSPELAAREDIQELLTSIGRHLGMAVEKTRVDTEAHRLALMQERNMLAHELHDSLAQTLASLRIQVKMLDETLQQSADRGAQREIQQITKGMDGAYRELRQLLVHCRAPMDERGLLPAIENMVERFRSETGIALFLQKDCPEFSLPPELEVQVLHIVQESLANVRKYSQARNVRVLLHCDIAGDYRVLVEDDGLGMARQPHETPNESLPGEHIGISIMQERARRLGGTLTVESEPGEGTRVLLTFHFHPQAARIRAS